jgi:hypothetical protein
MRSVSRCCLKVCLKLNKRTGPALQILARLSFTTIKLVYVLADKPSKVTDSENCLLINRLITLLLVYLDHVANDRIPGAHNLTCCAPLLSPFFPGSFPTSFPVLQLFFPLPLPFPFPLQYSPNPSPSLFPSNYHRRIPPDRRFGARRGEAFADRS